MRLIFVIFIIGLFFCSCAKQDTGPRQPIAFNHKIHAGDYKIACQYCHSGVRKTSTAYVPSVQLCMGCHQLVAATKSEVSKIRQNWEKNIPIEWSRVNQLADFVYFNHYPHIAKGIDCSKCHGDVASMSEVKPVIKVNNMTWCVNCHRENKASIDCYTCHR